MSRDQALQKAARKRTADDYPVHSFTSLLADLGIICANHIQPTDDMPAFTKITAPTPVQRQAFELLGVHTDSAWRSQYIHQPEQQNPSSTPPPVKKPRGTPG